jgi:hypothetical protein
MKKPVGDQVGPGKLIDVLPTQSGLELCVCCGHINRLVTEC